jgi:hypothetical protein
MGTASFGLSTRSRAQCPVSGVEETVEAAITYWQMLALGGPRHRTSATFGTSSLAVAGSGRTQRAARSGGMKLIVARTDRQNNLTGPGPDRSDTWVVRDRVLAVAHLSEA